jgi:ribosomal protein S18 acetylase RimI-like enzyme
MSVLRASTPGDAEHLERLEMALFPDNCLNSRSVRKIIERGYSLTVDEQGEPVGYALCVADQTYVDLLRLGVVAHRRGRGFGQQMLHRLSLLSLPLLLTVKRDNPAVQLYRRAGFSIVGVHSGSWVMVRTHGS